ncbi:molybdenum cofactor guanylyltransferase [Chitinophagaceae bacterium LWZ2-11]
MKQKNLYGLVLCGGMSTRMGRDKALLQNSAGEHWAASAYRKLQPLADAVYLSVNEQQYTTYEPVLNLPMIRDNDTLSCKGPVKGLLSAHLAYPGKDFFILACDMPYMDYSLLHDLHHQYECRQAEAYLYTLQANIEPLCGIYTAASLQKLKHYAGLKQYCSFGIKGLLPFIETQNIILNENKAAFFINCNTPDVLIPDTKR